MLLYAPGHDAPARVISLTVPAAAREWMLREGTFQLGGPAAARALGTLRERLVENFDAAIGAAVTDPHGLLAILVFGQRLMANAEDDDARTLLDALASLAALALCARPSRAGRTRPRAASSPRKPRASIEALRADHPPLKFMIGESEALFMTCQDLVAD